MPAADLSIARPFVRVVETSVASVRCAMPIDSFAMFAAREVGFACLAGHSVAIEAFV